MFKEVLHLFLFYLSGFMVCDVSFLCLYYIFFIAALYQSLFLLVAALTCFSPQGPVKFHLLPPLQPLLQAVSVSENMFFPNLPT